MEIRLVYIDGNVFKDTKNELQNWTAACFNLPQWVVEIIST